MLFHPGPRSAAPPPRISQIPTPINRSRSPSLLSQRSIIPVSLPGLCASIFSQRSTSVPPPSSRRDLVKPEVKAQVEEGTQRFVSPHKRLRRRSCSLDRKTDELTRTLTRTTLQHSLKKSDSTILRPPPPKSPRRALFNVETAKSWSLTLRRPLPCELPAQKKEYDASKKETLSNPKTMTPDDELARSALMREKYHRNHLDAITTLDCAQKRAEEGEKIIRHLNLRTQKLINEQGVLSTHSRKMSYHQRLVALQDEKTRATSMLEKAYEQVAREKYRLAQAKASLKKHKATSLQAISQIREDCYDDESYHDECTAGANIALDTPPLYPPAHCSTNKRPAPAAHHNTWGSGRTLVSTMTPPSLYGRPQSRQSTFGTSVRETPSVPTYGAQAATFRVPLAAGQVPTHERAASKKSNFGSSTGRGLELLAVKERLMRKINSVGVLQTNPRKPLAMKAPLSTPSTSSVDNIAASPQQKPTQQSVSRSLFGPMADSLFGASASNMSSGTTPSGAQGHNAGHPCSDDVGDPCDDKAGDADVINTALRDILQTAETLQEKWLSLPPNLQEKLQLYCT